ncbi:ATP-grasp fold, ATP-dependent carboxylate-amine ligase-type domain protein, partial [mine drainage metagenome]
MLSYKKGVVKDSIGGYDGKGQHYYNFDNIPEINSPGPFVVEEFVDYDYEASIISCRAEDGSFHSFEPSYNENLRGMLLSNMGPKILNDAKLISKRLMDALAYIGVMGIEFFMVGDKLLINEFAPRVHNSGHHTLMGNSISQFELHVRAVLGLPISGPFTFTPTGIVNIIGKTLNVDDVNNILKIPGTRIYSYGKEETKKRRKMGHV